MDWALKFNGPWGEPWKSGFDWTPFQTTMYIGWKGKVDNAHADALHCGGTVTMEYNLQLDVSVEEAIWVEEIRLQDEALDAEWFVEMLEHGETTYKLCQQDFTTWIANYQCKKRD